MDFPFQTTHRPKYHHDILITETILILINCYILVCIWECLVCFYFQVDLVLCVPPSWWAPRELHTHNIEGKWWKKCSFFFCLITPLCRRKNIGSHRVNTGATKNSIWLTKRSILYTHTYMYVYVGRINI